jgi:hypothetical protein
VLVKEPLDATIAAVRRVVAQQLDQPIETTYSDDVIPAGHLQPVVTALSIEYQTTLRLELGPDPTIAELADAIHERLK